MVARAWCAPAAIARTPTRRSGGSARGRAHDRRLATVVLARSIPSGAYDAIAGTRPSATAAERLLGGATLGVLLMHQFRYDACDSVACFAEGSLGGS